MIWRVAAHKRVRPIGISRIRPETHRFANEEQRQDCDKYRYWPKGTDEEPKECWHEWQERQPSGDPEREV